MSIRIDLFPYRGNRSSLFTGRTQGEDARKKINIDQFDEGDDTVVFVIPKNTTSINPSFYLGLLYKSIKKHGIDDFEKKFQFEIEEKDNHNIIKVLQDNLADGRRNAINIMNNNSSFKRFLE